MKNKLTFFDIVKTEEDYLNEIDSNDRDSSLLKLQELWNSSRPEYKKFCEDGILVEEDWDNSKTKIMFLLKETFDDFSKIKGIHPIKSGNSKTFWKKMKMWTIITDSIYNGVEINHNQAIKEKDKKNSAIAYVNIKKNVTKTKEVNKTNSSDRDILNYAVSDSLFLKNQIDLISPNVIICCGTFKYLKNILPSVKENRLKYNDVWIVKFRHLSNRKAYKTDNEELIQKLLEIKNCT